MESARTPLARWGLLITTLLTGAALVAAAWAGWLSARDAAIEVERARGLDLVFAARRALVVAGRLDDETLAAEFEDLSAQGVRYLAVVDSWGKLLASAGRAEGQLEGRLDDWPEDRPGRSVLRPVGAQGRLRVVEPLGRRGRSSPGRLACRGWGCRSGQALAGHWLVLEFEPALGERLTSRATWSLAVSLVAALALLGAAWFFWRQSRRAERFAIQVERDRRLAVLGEMSAVLGHELRNPLASLKGHAQLLLEKLPTDHPHRAGVETVVAEAQRLEVLTGQVLDFARTGELSKASVEVADLLRAAAEAHGQGRVDLVGLDGLGRWSLDAPRMLQVLANLLTNALQSSDPDQRVSLAAWREQDLLVIEVRDHGPGLAPEDLQRAFEPFVTSRARRTGLGLAVARRIVQGHGGRLEASNHPAGGAVFRLRLP